MPQTRMWVAWMWPCGGLDGVGGDGGGGAVFVDGAAQGFQRGGFAQDEVEGVDVAAQGIEQGAHVAVGGDVVGQAGFVGDLQGVVAVLFPDCFGVFEVAELAVGEGGDGVARGECAVDLVFGYAVPDDLAAFQGHAA